VLAGIAIAAAGALILGEYQFTWTLGPVAGVLFGLFVAEAVASVSRERGYAWSAFVAACSAGGLVWGGWISIRRTGHGLPAAAWIAVALGAAVAAVRVRPARAPTSSTSTEP
jgi:hypothetical protein